MTTHWLILGAAAVSGWVIGQVAPYLLIALLRRWEAWMDRRIDYASRCGVCCPCCDVIPTDEEGPT